ncbi:MAG: HAD family hydrolase [Myxococcota bacterium]|nr:HAD family hydrolase [Myxococcota bacterium]
MRSTVLLFDIDGTLITTGGVGRYALEHAVALHLGRQRESFTFSFAGMTDPVILRQGLEQLGEVASEAAVEGIMSSYLTVLEEEVRLAHDYRTHPGVVEVLEAVSGLSGVAVGLGTGNIEAGARVKLERVGLNGYFSFGGYGSDSADRVELIRAGAQRGAGLLNRPLSECRVVIIGDTVRDVAAAHGIGGECLAVTTGGGTLADLKAVHPEHLVEDLTEPSVIPWLLQA